MGTFIKLLVAVCIVGIVVVVVVVALTGDSAAPQALPPGAQQADSSGGTSAPTVEPVTPAPTTSVPTSSASVSDTSQPQTSRTNPARLNETVRAEIEDWLDGKIVMELELLELVDGTRAWNMVREWNQFNNAPGEGKEYVLAKFRVRIVAAEVEPYDLNHAQFDAYSGTGVQYTDFVSVAGMDPDLRTNLYAGAEHVGFTAFVVGIDDSPVTVYKAGWGNDAIWFDLRA